MRKFTLLFMTLFVAVVVCAQEADAPKITIIPDPSVPQTSLANFTLICEEGIKLSGKSGATLENPALGIVKELVGMDVDTTIVTLDIIDYTSVSDEGNWLLKVPEGYFVIGKDSVTTLSEAMVIRYQIAAAHDFGIESVDPASGSTVSVLKDITLRYNADISYTWQEMYLLNENKDTVTTVLPYLSDEEWNVMYLVPTDTITAAGKYTIELPEGLAKRYPEESIRSAATTLVYTVDGSMTAIEKVEFATDDKVVYDLAGRRVNVATRPGIYIVNGKKVMLK